MREEQEHTDLSEVKWVLCWVRKLRTVKLNNKEEERIPSPRGVRVLSIGTLME